MSEFNKEKDSCMENNPDESQSDLFELNQFHINDEQIENSFEEFPFDNGESKEEENRINEVSIHRLNEINVNCISSNEEEPEKEDNKEKKIIRNNLKETLKDKVKPKEEIYEIILIKERSINLSESKELNEAKKVLEAEFNDQEETRSKNISKSGKNKLKESPKIFFIYKDRDKKLIGKKRKSEHNEGDSDELDKDKFC